MYDRDLTEASKGALLELCMALSYYRGEFVLVGGWAPYFLTRQHFDHCGSVDIDFAVKPSIIPRYNTIKDVIEGLGYTVTGNPFRFERSLDTASGKSFTIHLDLLTEPEPALSQGYCRVNCEWPLFIYFLPFMASANFAKSLSDIFLSSLNHLMKAILLSLDIVLSR